MNRSTLVLFISLLLIALISAYWFFDKQQITEPSFTHTKEEEPDFFMEKVNSVQFNETGDARYRLRAQQLSHYPDTDISELTFPFLIIYRAGEPPWQINADYGKVLPSSKSDGEIIELYTNVIVHRELEDGNTVTLNTEKLIVKPDQEYAETDIAVKISSGPSKVNSVGMKAFFAEDRIEFLSKVRGLHVPIQ